MVESVSARCPGLMPAKQTEIITSTPLCLWFVLKCCGGFHIHEASLLSCIQMILLQQSRELFRSHR